MPKCEYSSISSGAVPGASTARRNAWSEDTGVPGPRKHQLAGAPRADHLIVDQIRREAREREVAPPLSDDLVPRGEADEVGEPLDDDGVAVVDEARDRVAHGHDLGGVIPHA